MGNLEAQNLLDPKVRTPLLGANILFAYFNNTKTDIKKIIEEMARKVGGEVYQIKVGFETQTKMKIKGVNTFVMCEQINFSKYSDIIIGITNVKGNLSTATRTWVLFNRNVLCYNKRVHLIGHGSHYDKAMKSLIELVGTPHSKNDMSLQTLSTLNGDDLLRLFRIFALKFNPSRISPWPMSDPPRLPKNGIDDLRRCYYEVYRDEFFIIPPVFEEYVPPLLRTSAPRRIFGQTNFLSADRSIYL